MNSRDSALDETQEPKATAPILPSSSVRVSSPSSYEGAKSGAVTAPARTARIPRAPNSSKPSLLAAFLAGPRQKRDHTYPIVKHPVTPHCALWRRWPRRPIIFGVTATAWHPGRLAFGATAPRGLRLPLDFSNSTRSHRRDSPNVAFDFPAPSAGHRCHEPRGRLPASHTPRAVDRARRSSRTRGPTAVAGSLGPRWSPRC